MFFKSEGNNQKDRFLQLMMELDKLGESMKMTNELLNKAKIIMIHKDELLATLRDEIVSLKRETMMLRSRHG